MVQSGLLYHSTEGEDKQISQLKQAVDWGCPAPLKVVLFSFENSLAYWNG